MRRSDEHFDALQDSIHEFFGRDPYEVAYDLEPESNQYVVRVKVRERPPPEWSPVIGDIVHNMRSALDHLAWQLVIRNGCKPFGKTRFPIFSRDPFDRSLYSKTKHWKNALNRWQTQTEGMHPRDIAFLKDLQPYQRMDDATPHPLDWLKEFSNWDKHRELHFATSAFVGPLFYLKESSRNVAIQPFDVRLRGDVFEDGAEVARFEAVSLGCDPYVDVDIKVMYEVAFGEGSPLEGLWIKQTLLDIGQYVWDILLRFKIYFDGQMF